MTRRLLPLAATLALAACAYFNALYNARRAFADAERAAARGDLGTAQNAYATSIEKAAKSLRRDPDGRWADDALYLIGRAHFARGDDPKAIAALHRLLASTHDPDLRAGAHAYLGAATLRLARPPEAAAHLDSAILDLQDDDGSLAAFAHLWRARARFTLGQDTTAWDDLDRAARQNGPTGREARLEAARRAILDANDPARATTAFAALLRDKDAHRAADSLRQLTLHAAQRWDPATARRLLEPAAHAPWPRAARELLLLHRARLAALAGDTATATAEAHTIATRATGTVADEARVLLARWQLASASELDHLEHARTLLLPALANPEARTLLQTIRMIAVLLERARAGGQPLALFAAAELARDQLGAPALARTLFTTYAELDPQAPWAAKAILAALTLEPPTRQADSLRQRLATYPDNAYLTHHDDHAFQDAEERLAQTLTTLLQHASIEAQQRDAPIVRAAALLDSARAAARADTLRLACTTLLDSLRLRGIRADSVRAACLRGQHARIDSLLRIDTLRLRPDSARARPDTIRQPHHHQP